MYPLSGSPARVAALALSCALVASVAACGGSDSNDTSVPDAITQIMKKPMYQGSTWALRVVDLNSGDLIYDMNSNAQVYVASVRKVFSLGAALDQYGADHQFQTPVYRLGAVDATGTLNGNLVLVASGDLSMGGRTNPDGTLAWTNFDHNEANSLGNAQITAPDPLAGYDSLAAQVAASGIRKINGEVVIDDRLFDPFDFRDEFELRPIFVNDDVVDTIISQGSAGSASPVDYRPKSSAFTVQSTLTTGAAGTPATITVTPADPTCFGTLPCGGVLSGSIPADYVPPIVPSFPVIRTFRITQPSNYARSVLIDALARAGVTVAAPAVENNPVQLLPAKNAYSADTRVAQLTSQPYGQYSKWILKVSYNIGADTSLMLFGVANNGSTTLNGALAAENAKLSAAPFNVPMSQTHFIDGSGGGETTATPLAVIAMLRAMNGRPAFPAYVDSMPFLGVDGSLASTTDFESDPTLAGAKGKVYAKTGTYATGTELPDGQVQTTLKGQALAGYIDAKSGRRLAFALMVNNVPIANVPDILNVFNDQGTIAANIWKLQ
ncbi:D-alanyl-D-alanine carboxypeptidase/D-alanyl-D-alanine-endopeptidase [Caballeronia novacaledonica]|uniref:D-alanyl-D-alanine carboxypeptidase/D-alanyl-D-alanine-endopeptidase n=1 Tax=Caballeronia novacaledonica TaxID=1544861 RepID=A0A2U3I5C7_9BURK|nr:D-alanyl-D-alanine carboxypeptidase [Caballeronia novacaledonica]SPB15352.1 D-alanyl-D-alanine carboxypeptidase/D-alanyl-D-alanine-endopeptidase [Caballeronia novacaledonica]